MNIQNVTRRSFLSTSCLTVSGITMGFGPKKLSGRESSRANAIPNINPGFIGPQFFDEREKQALMEVMESGSPFRYWGPGKPTKVLRFEEGFAKHMGTRFALGVTSGTAALDCAVTGLGVGPGDKLLTICNCCPCCCLWGILPHIAPRIGDKVSRMEGVTVTTNGRCVGCGICARDVCFVDAIHVVDDRAVIGDACRGCGRCVDVCPEAAIELSISHNRFVERSIARISPLVDGATA